MYDDNKDKSVREQFDALFNPESEPEEQEPITDRFNRKSDDDIFKEVKKEKESSKDIIKLIIVLTPVIFALLLGGVILFTKDKGTQSSKEHENKVTEVQNTPDKEGNEKYEDTTQSRLQNPPEINTADDALVQFSQINQTIIGYLTEMKDIIIEYNDRDRNDIYIEDLMQPYKESLLRDIDMLAKYKKIYDNYGASDLYLATISRLQNAYELARTSKNVMTEKALVRNTNSYIEKEEELNTRATTALLSFLENNDIEYNLNEETISVLN